MGKLTRVLEKSGYAIDLSCFKEPQAEIEFGLAEQDAIVVKRKPDKPEQKGKQGYQRRSVVQDNKLGKLNQLVDLSPESEESLQHLCSQILHPEDGGGVPRSIMIASVLPGEGRSFVSAHLGIALATMGGQHSILVDCDLRLLSLAKLLGVSREKGLADYLLHQTNLVDLLQKTSVDNMSLLSSGNLTKKTEGLLGSVRMHDLVNELMSGYPEHIAIFDTAPLQVVSESIALSFAVDGVVLVVGSEHSSKSMIKKVIADIGSHKILGIIFNGHGANWLTSKFIPLSQYCSSINYKKQ